MRSKILLVEDDCVLAFALKDYFEDHGLSVYHTANGDDAITLYQQNQPHLILLDIILPGKNGFEIATEIHEIDVNIPIIMMTGSEFDPDSQIKGYELGALNYMKKPILPKALLALIQNLLTLPRDLKCYNLGELSIRVHSQCLEINNNKFNLREKDAILLTFMLDRINQTISRKMLLSQIWLDDSPEKNNHLDGAILRIRRLFHPYKNIQIKTVYGNGYILETL